MRWSIPVLVVLTAACSAPEPDRRHTALQSAAAVLAIDFSPAAVHRRSASWARLPSAMRTEFSRAGELTEPVGAVAPELHRVNDLRSTAGAIAGDELARRPAVPEHLRRWGSTLGQNLADDMVEMATAVMGRHRAMPEIDDRRHRTDPHDDHPEATVWQRLRRRLWL